MTAIFLISGAVSCYFEIETKPEYLAQVTDILYKNDTVSQIYRVTGRDRLHVHAVASSGDEMEYFLQDVYKRQALHLYVLP